jgi:hypothetical protein
VNSSELAREVFALVEARIRSRPSPIQFEMAYQARIAIEQIRFAIRQIEKHVPAEHVTASEISLQLTDALERLQCADRHFQEQLRGATPTAATPDGENDKNSKSTVNGTRRALDTRWQ